MTSNVKTKAREHQPSKRTISRGPMSAAAKAREDAVRDLTSTTAGIKLAPTTRRTSIQRRSRDRISTHTKNGSGLTVSGGSSGSRSGGRNPNNYTVASVGINGRIYLRPVIHPASERQKPPSFIFPASPQTETTSNAPIATQTIPVSVHGSKPATLRDSVWSGTLPSKQRLRESGESFQAATNSVRGGKLQRAHSFSTVEEYNAKERETTAVRMGRPRLKRYKSAEAALPTFLKVEIPHYRLGTPRFSTFGTAMLRSSAYTHNSSNEDLRSSLFAPGDIDELFPVTTAVDTRDFISNWNTNAQAVAHGKDIERPPSPPLRRSLEPIRPVMYDHLTFPPGADDPKIIRYSPTTGQLVAATAPRIIAQITSANFLDYELLSDFFLTYRGFMRADDLVGYLLTRLQWAIYRGGDTGSIVRVRAFVAIRHWILNYFVDDFVPNMALRRLFCDMLNALTESVKRRSNPAPNDLNLIGEVKKCWRRTCALYWDGPHFTGDGRADETLCPGGFPGTRADGCHPSTNHLSDSVDGDRLAPLVQVPASEYEGGSLMQEVTRASHLYSDGAAFQLGKDKPASTLRDRRISPNSDASVPALSCSFPIAALLKPETQSNTQASSRPVEISSQDKTGSLAPKSTLPTNLRPIPSPIPARAPLTPRDAFPSEQPQMALPFAGSLVRGTILPPGEAYVEAIAPKTPSDTVRPPNVRAARSYNAVVTNQQRSAGAMQPSMKKIFENLRRVFSNRMVETQQSLAAENRTHQMTKNTTGLNVTANEANIHPAHRQKPSIRIDILGATVVELFNETLKTTYGAQNMPGYASGGSEEDVRADDKDQNPRQAVRSQITNGSDSIVIVDDTDPLLSAVMSSSLGGQLSNAAVASASPSPPERTAADRPFPLEEPPRDSFDPGQRQTVPIMAEENILNPRASEDSKLTSSIQSRRSAFKRHPSSLSGRTHSLRKFASFQSGLTKAGIEHGTSDRDVQIILEEGPVPIGRSLKRRPGGDLRNVDLVRDLEYFKRPRSEGSLTGYSESILSTNFHPSAGPSQGAAARDVTDEPRQTLSLTAFGQPQSKSTSDSAAQTTQPVLRPSFEAEVAKLAQIPDDVNDDGGIESTLAKLEGTFEKRNSESSFGLTETTSDLSFEGDEAISDHRSSKDKAASRNRHKHVMENVLSAVPKRVDPPSTEQKSDAKDKRPALETGFRSGSEESASSIPLLDREYSDESASDRQPSPDRVAQSPSSKPFTARRPNYEEDRESHPSIVQVEETDSVRELREESISGFHKERVTDSFLLDEDEDFSDLSSELSDDEISQTDLTSPKSAAFNKGVAVPHHPERGLGAHPLRHPPSPPTAVDNAIAYRPKGAPKQDTIPPAPTAQPDTGARQDPNTTQQLLAAPTIKPLTVRALKKPKSNAAHLPFILAHDSRTLAQQLTLVEKDALNEIDWKELVDLKWKQNPPTIHNWVEYLRDNQPKGLELVVVRFNLVVKWVVSEIILTANMQERANTIIKFIHIAAHSRRLRNYSTMYQLTIGLTSSDVSRLSQTWNIIPKDAKHTLRELEQLVSPLHNFNNLRLEMEGITADEGCIPFIGIYTHDLIYNAQRPAQITVSLKSEPLVNFERFRITAGIVKDLLRLLEASAKYTFAPVDGLIEKCLWIAALSEHDIRAYGKEIS